MNLKLVDQINAEQLKKDVPSFKSGDTVKVMVRIIESGKERLQAFEGIVIARKGSGINESFKVRKVSNGIGVHRIFPIHAPTVASIEVLKKGKVRRNKLTYLSKLSGKAARIKEVLE
ncbi:MAG: 50S ribosomal protein L19 [Bacilli bacterium]